MSIFSIVIIGMGGIGFRHFQAFSNLRIKARMACVDVDYAALEKARNYFREASNPNILSVEYVIDIDNLPDEIDLAIVATSSLPRRSIIEKLLARSSVKYLLLEKFLFPRMEDYEVVETLLHSKQVKAFINCPRRMYPCYITLRERLKSDEILSVYVTGSHWGLGSNAIHIIDLMDFLIGDGKARVTCSGVLLDNGVQESKRKGYVEFTGKLIGHIGQKTGYVLESTPTGENFLIITLFSKTGIYTISESERIMLFYDSSGALRYKEELLVPYQSQLTNVFAEKLLIAGECHLTSYECSTKLHLSLLAAILEKQNMIFKEESEICRIT